MSLCRCGCGQDAGVWPKTYTRFGVRKGDPLKYINGHRCKRDMDTMYVIDPVSGCWNWTGNLEGGYGRLGKYLAYGLFYRRAKGPKPVGMDLDHLCRNRACVNPDHLEAVTRAVNCRRGSRARLTLEQARQIIDESVGAKRGINVRLAKKFGVSPSTICNVRFGHTWRDARRVA